jgi:prepilin signal peptidase PulO-like enzyme (type II secretory pathway)
MLAALAVGVAFAALGAAAERLASVWPAGEASHRSPGVRTAMQAIGAGLAGGAVTWRSTLPTWALAVYLLILAILVLLTATDLEQRRLPHVLLDPLIVVAAVFVPFNPAVGWADALIGAASAVAFLGLLGLLVRGGVALGDLFLVAPLGAILGWPAIFIAMFVAGLLSAVVSVGLLLMRRAGLKSYIPFGPFLVAGTVITLLREPDLLRPASLLLAALLGG